MILPFRVLTWTLVIVGALAHAPCCAATKAHRQQSSYSTDIEKMIHANDRKTPVYGFQVVNTYPHDRSSFTQGLLYDKGFLYESTGLYGRSTIRKVELRTGTALKVRRLPIHFFGEGLAIWRDRLIQLTWRSRRGILPASRRRK